MRKRKRTKRRLFAVQGPNAGWTRRGGFPCTFHRFRATTDENREGLLSPVLSSSEEDRETCDSSKSSRVHGSNEEFGNRGGLAGDDSTPRPRRRKRPPPAGAGSRPERGVPVETLCR